MGEKRAIASGTPSRPATKWVAESSVALLSAHRTAIGTPIQNTTQATPSRTSTNAPVIRSRTGLLQPYMRLLDHRNIGMGGEQRLREHVVEREHREQRRDHGLVDGPSDPLGASGRVHPLVTADHRDD